MNQVVCQPAHSDWINNKYTVTFLKWCQNCSSIALINLKCYKIGHTYDWAVEQDWRLGNILGKVAILKYLGKMLHRL